MISVCLTNSLLKIRVDNSTDKPKKLTDKIQKNLMKLSNGKGNDAHRDR